MERKATGSRNRIERYGVFSHMLESMLQDVRYATRGFVRTPGPFVIAIATLA
ncbi:MAG: hypothetical protein H7Y20_18330, partial [Bryobacteraceae bacterium]|nr:hypothetical protein [Bryobacteraceae bacterium]